MLSSKINTSLSYFKLVNYSCFRAWAWNMVSSIESHALSTQRRNNWVISSILFKKKKSQLSCLVVGRPNNNLPVIFVTGHRTDRDCHDVLSPFLWVPVTISGRMLILSFNPAKENTQPIAHEHRLSLSNLSMPETSKYSVKTEHLLWIKPKY